MANPLQPKCAKVLEVEYNAFNVIVTSTAKSGVMDILSCIPKDIGTNISDAKITLGLFYGFEIKWKSDQPSELQKQKINEVIDAGGRAYFIRSVDELRNILNNNIPPIKYEIEKRFKL